MDRQLVYPGAIPLETDLLSTNRNTMIGLAKLAAAIMGSNTFMNGLACTPDSPASLNVKIGPGEIYSLQNIDGTAYSSLASDTAHSIMKQGILLDTVLLACPAPVTSGHSINYLVQVAYQDVDANPVVLPYYNASNPAMAYSGPSNSGSQNYTTRKGVCTVSVKAGTSAPTGSQTTPAADAGYVAAYVVTVAYGQTQILAGNISAHSSAPFLPSLGLVVGGLQNNACISAAAGGTADALTASFTPPITALPASGAGVTTLFVRPSAANATTTPTFTPNSGTIAAKTIVKGNGIALAVGDIAGAGHWLQLQYDATLDKWVLLNPAKGVLVLTDASTTTKGKVQLATSAESQALSDALKAITPSTLGAAFQGSNQSMAASGYQKLPGGLIIQWGTMVLSSATSVAITFPITFPNEVYGIFNHRVSDGPSAYELTISASTPATTSGCTFKHLSNPITETDFWIAIGR